jgi:hypothetical protein
LRPKANLVILDPGSGKARPGAFVTIYRANTLDKAALFADDDLTTIGNPVQANGLGQVAVRLNPGLYDVSMIWDGAMPTVVEDVTVLQSEVVITSPGDLIIGNADGNPVRLAVGTNGQVLFVENGLPAWKALGAGVGLPVGASGSLLSYGPTGALLPILPGLQDQALAMMGGVPTWVSTLLPPGTTLPINQPGDLVVGAVTTGLPARLARGAPTDVLTTSDTGGLVWQPNQATTTGGGAGRLFFHPESNQLVFNANLGDQLWIDGRSRMIPTTGIGLLPTGLTVGVTYYIYAAWVSDAMQLEASTTVWGYTAGLYHKLGDPSRTLVGMARTIAGPAWTDSRTARFVLSMFSTVSRAAYNWFTAPRTVAGVVEVHPEIRIEFLTWGQMPVIISLSGMVNTSIAGIFYVSLTVDGLNKAGHALSMPGPDLWMNNGLSTVVTDLTEGHHTASLLASPPAGGTLTFTGDAAGIFTTRLNVLIPQ